MGARASSPHVGDSVMRLPKKSADGSRNAVVTRIPSSVGTINAMKMAPQVMGSRRRAGYRRGEMYRVQSPMMVIRDIGPEMPQAMAVKIQVFQKDPSRYCPEPTARFMCPR